MFKWLKKDKDSKEVTIEEKNDLKDFEEVEEDLEELIEKEAEDLNNDLKTKKSTEIFAAEEIEKTLIPENAREEVISAEENLGFFGKLINGLTKTRKEMSNKIDSIIASYKKIDEELFDDLEEALVTADVGVNTTMTLIDNLRIRIKQEKVSDPLEVKNLLKDEMKILMKKSVEDNSLNIEPSPCVILVVGVNGVGKTTTIGKLAHNFKKEGKKVLIAAGDTFRAAAIEQLEEWSNRSSVEFISHNEGSDPAAVIFDAIQAAKARNTDILICDTAGRLHNKSNLMNELNKIFRIIDREYSEASKEILLVLDATTGQNAIIQARTFKEVANITGVALTKLDGTAKGGVVIALQAELELPIKLIGIGEGIEDLQTFNVDDFIDGIID